MHSENQGLYLIFCYETGNCLYFAEYAIWNSRSTCTLFSWDRQCLYFAECALWKSTSICILLLWNETLPLLWIILPLKIKTYMYSFAIKPTLPVLCRIFPLKIKVFMYPFAMTPDTTFTFQNMPSEDQNLYVPFFYETRSYLYFPEYALWKSRSISTLLLWDQTLPLLCRICPLKIKIYMYPSDMRLDTRFTLQNIPSENQDL